MELCIAFMGFIPFLLVGAVILGFAFWMNSRHEEAMKQVATTHGLRFHEGGVFGGNCKVEGEIDDTHVIVDTYTSGSGKNKSTYTRFRVKDLAIDPSLSVGSEGVLSFIGKAFQGQDYEVGDKAFDDAVLVRGGHTADVCATFDVNTRQAVYKAVNNSWKLTGSEWSLRRSGRMSDARQMSVLIERGVEAARATRRRDGTVLERLERIYRDDPQPRVRANALKERVKLKPAMDAAELHELAQDPSWMGLVAAHALGTDAAIEHLHFAMENGEPPGVRMTAAEMLAASSDPRVDRARVEKVFRFAVEHEPWIDRAIRGLEKVGTVDAVPVLLEYADGFLPSARKTAAKKAVRAIQSRIGGAGRGQLAIAQAQGGELSEVEVKQRGALSQAAKQPER